MRRKNQQITDLEQIDEMIQQCDCCRLGLNDGGAPYIVPLSFGYMRQSGRPVFFFHGAREGRKIDLVKQNERAGFELDSDGKLNEHSEACGHSARYQSVIGTGRVSLVEDAEQKQRALRLIMEHYTGRSDWDMPDKAIAATAVIRLDVDELACKFHA